MAPAPPPGIGPPPIERPGIPPGPWPGISASTATPAHAAQGEQKGAATAGLHRQMKCTPEASGLRPPWSANL
eukprot:1395642-Pyramimonas_sp.AAC.1